MQRRLRFLVAVSLAIAAGACSRDSTPLAPGAPADSLGLLVFSSSAKALFTPAWSNHTDRIYFIEPVMGMRELDPASGAVRTLAEDAAQLVMAPNGRALYYTDQPITGHLDRIDLETEQHTVVADSVFVPPVPSNGDLLVAYTHWVDALVVAAPSGSNAEVVASLGFPFAFSPDDRELLYAKHPSLHPALNKDPLQVRDLDTGLVREIPSDVPGVPLGRPYWGARGITIAFADQGYTRLWVRNGDLDRMLFSSPEWIDTGSASWSPGGTRLAFLTYGHDSRGRTLTAWVVELETSRVFHVAHGLGPPDPDPDPTGMPTILYSNATTFSPDGRSLAFTSAGKIFIAPID